jgi:hypothetical protein
MYMGLIDQGVCPGVCIKQKENPQIFMEMFASLKSRKACFYLPYYMKLEQKEKHCDKFLVPDKDSTF